MALNPRECARLTGQSVATMELFRPVRNIWRRAGEWAAAVTTIPGLTWMSRYIYHYPRTMLLNLGPRSPDTRGWPFFQLPPPHFLVGYQYLVRVCNDYIFDERAYSRIQYHQILAPSQQVYNWSVLANCVYTINTGAYHRFVDLDDFQGTLAQIQQAILAERVVADLALLQPLRGYGVTNFDADQNVPVERLMQDFYRDIGSTQPWGLAERVRIQNAGKKDLVVLTNIRRLKNAYFNFLISQYQQPAAPLSLPCDCLWLDAFLQRFGDSVTEDSAWIREIPVQQLIKCIVSTLSLPGTPPGAELRGGAFELRPRENGRAVTQEMRRRRGEMVQRFIESLPIRRRRRRAPTGPPIYDEEDAAAAALEEEEEEEEPPRSFEEEVRAAVAEVIRLLEEELTVAARNHDFFNFAINFYQAMQDLDAAGDISESTIRRWVMYFFVTEHIATTLNYLHHNLRNYRTFARYVELNIAQVVMRARDAEGNVVYSRVWNESNGNAMIQLMRRIGTDLAATVTRAGRGDLDEEEIEQFMADIAYHDNSGDVQEILRQVAVNDTLIDSVELSFRAKVTGPIVFSENPRIQNMNRQVVRYATALRQNLQPLPELNTQMILPY
nr:pre-terminal protein [Lemur mastadenovirus]